MRDERYPQTPVATLQVVEQGQHQNNIYLIDVNMEVATPLTLQMLVKRAGNSHITGTLAADWIAGRATPAGRQNIDEVLQAINLKQYDAWKIVLGHRCRCTRDHIYMEEV